MTGPDQAAHAYLGAFVEELSRAGVRHVCIAPGSRSTPIAMLVAGHAALRTWMHLDERSAGFFALGMARVLGEPVALLCTSGSAAANFLPAVVEARGASVPLLVLTADRPPELREVGAAQTIDQSGLYGTHAKWFVDVALPEATPELLRHARALAGRAVATAVAAPAGPVHLNFPLREPLVPVAMPAPEGLDAADALAWRGRPGSEPWVRVSRAAAVPDAATLSRLLDRLRAARRPLLVCGPQHDPRLAAPLARLCARMRIPLLCDPLSQLRWGGHERSALVDRYDAALRDDATAARLAPDLVLRFGAVPTSKPLMQFLQRHGDAAAVVVQPAGWSDPTLLAAEMVHADPAALCEALLGATDSAADATRDEAWLREWRAVDAIAARALDVVVAGLDELFEGRVLADIARALPSGGTLFVSSSMPVRDLDAFAAGDARALRVLANRGANGIDGIVSSALGAAAAARELAQGALVLAIGDVAMYHDMNGLLAARLHALDATIVVINNDGGGIFSFLPQAGHPEHFERLFGTPHGLEFAHAAAMYGARHQRVEHPGSLRGQVERAVATPGLDIIELRTDRRRNVELHRMATAAVAAALSAG